MQQYFSQVVERNAKNVPNRTAYEFFDQQTTWKEYYEDINRVTNSFIKLGLRKGDKIATVLPQSPAFMNVFMAAATMGLVVVPLDVRYKAEEMIERCRRTEPKLIVSLANEDAIKQEVGKLLQQVHIPHVYSYLGELETKQSLPYEQLFEGSIDPIPSQWHPSLEDPLIVIFTGGTTGIPKGALLTHKNAFSNAERMVTTWDLSGDDRVLINLPTNHVGGTILTIAVQLFAGATGILSVKFNPQEVLKMIEEYKITYMPGVATMYRLIFQNSDVKDYDLTSMKKVLAAGESISPQLAQQILESFPNAFILRTWGMTETSGPFTLSNLDDDFNSSIYTEGVVGKGNEMKIVKPDGTNADPNEVGEILVKGDSVMTSYLDEENNIDAFSNGWFKTGDLGYLDEQGYLHFTGRAKDMYISGGYNVYPAEVETHLNAHPSVNTSCIVEVPDDIWGEVGVAFVVLEEDIDVDVLIDYCKQGLAGYKVPKRMVILPELPRTLVGKIAKHELRKSIESLV